MALCRFNSEVILLKSLGIGIKLVYACVSDELGTISVAVILHPSHNRINKQAVISSDSIKTNVMELIS